MATSTERRRYPRFDVPCRLRIELPDGVNVRTRTLNISDGGAYFVTDAMIEVGRKVTVRLAVPRDTANTFFLEQFAAKAEVIRRDALAGKTSAGSAAGATGQAGVAVKFEKALALDLP